MADEQTDKKAHVPLWDRVMNRRTALKVGGGAAVLTGLGAGVGAYLLSREDVQRGLIYSPKKNFGGKDLEDIKDPAEYGLKNITAETLTTNAGDEFLTWHSDKLQPNKKTLVFFPGNGGHLGESPVKGPDGKTDLGEDDQQYVKLIREAVEKGYQVVFVNHVGFAGSNTAPTEEKMYQGAERTIDWLLEQGIAPKDLHISGISMGTAMAAHAASHLSQQDQFTGDKTQEIRLSLVNGLIDVQAGLDAFAPAPVSAFTSMSGVLKDRLDTGKELKAMGASDNAGRIHVSFIRGDRDPVTPENQIEAHQKAAEGLKFSARTVEGSHFVKPEMILESFKQMRAGAAANRAGLNEALGNAR